MPSSSPHGRHPLLTVSSLACFTQIAFLDAEGQGDRGLNYDIQLVAPLLLLATSVIFNWFGRPEKDTMLMKLGCLAKAAQRIDTPEGARKPFGHLYIILRDNPDDTGVKEMLLDDEGDGCDPIPEDYAERNQVRQLLRNSYLKISVLGFPAPVENTQLDFTPEQVTDAFKSKIDELREAVSVDFSEPRLVGSEDKPLTAQMAAGLARSLVSAVNKNAAKISPKSAFMAMQQMETDGMQREVLKRIDSFVDCLSGQVSKQCVDRTALEQQFDSHVLDCIESCREAAAALLSESQLSEWKAQIIQGVRVKTLRSSLLDACEKARLKYEDVLNKIRLAFREYASARKAELEENTNCKSSSQFEEEVEDKVKESLETDLAAEFAKSGLEGGLQLEGLRDRLREEFANEVRRLNKANTNANRRLNGEIVVDDFEWAFKWTTGMTHQPVLCINHSRTSTYTKSDHIYYRLAVTTSAAESEVASRGRLSKRLVDAFHQLSAKSVGGKSASGELRFSSEVARVLPPQELLPKHNEDQRNDGTEYCFSVWRKVVHFEWLDDILRKDLRNPTYKTELEDGAIKLPKLKKSILSPSSWLAKPLISSAMMRHLTEYLERLFKLPTIRHSLHLKIFLSPDEIFRPVYKASGSGMFSSSAVAPEDALNDISSASGPRLVHEHALFPKLVEWIQLQLDKELCRELSAQCQAHEKQVIELEQHKQNLDEICEREIGKADGVKTEHEKRTAEITETNNKQKERIKYADVLAGRQRTAVELLYQPNRANDEAVKGDSMRLQDLIELQERERETNAATLNDVKKHIAEVNNARQQLRKVHGKNDSVERYRAWSTLHPSVTWTLTPARQDDKICKEMADQKQRLNVRLESINRQAKAQIDEYNETLHKLERLETALEANKVRMDDLDKMHEVTRLLIKSEMSKRNDESGLRQAKIKQIEDDIARREKSMSSISKSQESSAAKECLIAERSLTKLSPILTKLSSRHSVRVKARAARLDRRSLRCQREEGRATEQRRSTRILFFDRKSDENERAADAQHVLATAAELAEDRPQVADMIAKALDDKAWLAQRQPSLEQDRRELSNGNVRLAAEVEASGVTSLPAGDGEIDPELKGFRIRRGEIDQELKRLSELLETEHQEFLGRVSHVTQAIDELTKMSELHAAENLVANEETAMEARENKALEDDDELLGHKKDDIQAPLLVAKKRHEEGMRLTTTLRDGVRTREAALSHRRDATVQRLALHGGLEQEHEDRVNRTNQWLQQEGLRVQHLKDIAGISEVPDSSELDQKRSADKIESEASCSRLETHLKALTEDNRRCDPHVHGSDGQVHIAEAARAERLLHEFSEWDVAGLLEEDTSKEANDSAINALEEGKFRRELEQVHTNVVSLHRRIIHELTTEMPFMERLSTDLREQRDMLAKEREITIALTGRIRQHSEQVNELSAAIVTRNSLVQSKVSELDNDIHLMSSTVEQLILSCAKLKDESDIRIKHGCQLLGATIKPDVADKIHALKANIEWYGKRTLDCTTVVNRLISNVDNAARPDEGDRVMVTSGIHKGRFGQVFKDGRNDFFAKAQFMIVFEEAHNAEQKVKDYVFDTIVTRAGTKRQKFKEEWRMLDMMRHHTASTQSFRDASLVGGVCIERLEMVGGAMAEVKQYMAQAEEAKGGVVQCRKDAQSLYAPHGGKLFDRWKGQKISQHPSLADCHLAISNLRGRALELDRLVDQVEKELHDSSYAYEALLTKLERYQESVGQLRTIFDGEYQTAQNEFNVALQGATVSFNETRQKQLGNSSSTQPDPAVNLVTDYTDRFSEVDPA